ncbi:MAG: YceI family protein [Anaeromyxobacter sp.]
MKKLVLAAVLALPALASAQSTWDFDPAHSHASFTVRHMGISNVRGEFQKMTGKLVLDEKDVTKSTVEATIETASVNTRIDKRDGHLKSPDFFDVAKYPTITFKSTKVEKAGEGKLKVTGDLTMKGVTKPVVLDVTGPGAPVKNWAGKELRGVEATATINRKDWGVNWSNMVEGVAVVADEVKVELEAELVKADAAAATPAAGAKK